MMDFMEAVKAMKEGKKVRRKTWSGEKYIYMAYQDDLISTQDEKLFGMWISDVEETDWEVVDDTENGTSDKDWNLADKKIHIAGEGWKYFLINDIKKCGDLLIKDAYKEICKMDNQHDDFKRGYVAGIKFQLNIESERFGDL